VAKAWIEMLHRYLATTVGALVVVLAVGAQLGSSTGARTSRHLGAPRSPRGGRQSGMAWFAVVWVCAQGALGALTVTWKLFPVIVTLHLLGGLGLLALLSAQVQHDAGDRAPCAERPAPLSPFWLGVLGVAGAVLAAQAALGGWVSANYAVLACAEFPQCQGQWWPQADWGQGFALWRPLGHSAQGDVLSFDALVAIHWGHRVWALVVVLVWGALAWRLWRAPGWQRWARAAAGVLTAQGLTGLSNVVLDWPLAAALLHSAGAALWVVLWSRMWVRARQVAPVRQTVWRIWSREKWV